MYARGDYHERSSSKFMCVPFCGHGPYTWSEDNEMVVRKGDLLGVECMNCHRLHWRFAKGAKREYRDVTKEELKELHEKAHRWWREESKMMSWVKKRRVLKNDFER